MTRDDLAMIALLAPLAALICLPIVLGPSPYDKAREDCESTGGVFAQGLRGSDSLCFRDGILVRNYGNL